MLQLNRREVLMGAGYATAALALTTLPAAAKDAKDTVESALAAFTGGKTPTEGKVALALPEIAENGNTVPLGISVESPMTKDDYVKRVLVLADGNPRPGVATFNFTSRSGVAQASTRLRLAKTQNVIAVAETSNGEYFMAKSQVKVTIGGCGG